VFRRVAATACSAILLASVFAALLVTLSERGSGGEKPPPPYALIFGTVWDPDGRPVYGVKVKIRRADEKKVRWELYSNHTGEFAQRVPVGKADYIVSADTKGYKLSTGAKLKPGADVTVHIDSDERSDIGLHLDWE
jgi:hypothetical protein